MSKTGAIMKGTKNEDAFILEAWMTRRTKEEVTTRWSEKWDRDKGRQGREYGLTPETRYKATQLPGVRREKVLVSRLRTGHVNVNSYLKRIGKKESGKCECRIEKQTVEHVLLRCALAAEKRGRAYAALKDVSRVTPLYTEEGLEWAIKIWDEFARNRRREREEGGEDIEEMGKIWGMGDLN